MLERARPGRVLPEEAGQGWTVGTQDCLVGHDVTTVGEDDDIAQGLVDPAVVHELDDLASALVVRGVVERDLSAIFVLAEASEDESVGRAIRRIRIKRDGLGLNRMVVARSGNCGLDEDILRRIVRDPPVEAPDRRGWYRW